MFYKLYKNGEINSYDMFKILAFLLMFLDHLGFYIFQASWLRTIGRLSFPIFAILHGISFKSTSSRVNLLIYGVLTAISSFLILRVSIFPLNILFAFFIFDMVFDEVSKLYYDNVFVGIVLLLACIVFGNVFSYGLEYGIFALLFMIVGKNFSKIGTNVVDILFSLATFISYVVMQSLRCELTKWQIVFFACGMIFIYLKMCRFKIREYYHLKSNKILLFISRYSLELYFIHILILSIIYRFMILSGIEF